MSKTDEPFKVGDWVEVELDPNGKFPRWDLQADKGATGWWLNAKVFYANDRFFKIEWVRDGAAHQWMFLQPSAQYGLLHGTRLVQRGGDESPPEASAPSCSCSKQAIMAYGCPSARGAPCANRQDDNVAALAYRPQVGDWDQMI